MDVDISLFSGSIASAIAEGLKLANSIINLIESPVARAKARAQYYRSLNTVMEAIINAEDLKDRDKLIDALLAMLADK